LDLLLIQAQETSPALARYRAIAQTQRSALAERRADQWPEVYARLERQFGNFSVSGMAPETRAFVGLTSRFGAGLSNQSSIAEAQGQLDAALAEIDVQLLGLQEQVMVDHTVLMQSEPRRVALQQGAAKSRLVLQSWDRQFLSGRKTWQDLMNSAREHIQLEAQIADLEASRLVAFWRLMALTDSAQLPHLP
jgi:adhesin transport system outer membrane protein